jgi:hypothetical protein
MMMLSDMKLLEKWDGITSYNNGYVRIDSEHPLDWHIGFENINQKSLLLITPFEPERIPSSKSILVAVRQRADSKWTLSFRLVRSEQEDVFIRLCCDLIESSRSQTNTIQGLEFVLDRYYQWSKLMEVQRSGLLSEPERRGLIGELLFLQQQISKGMPLLDVVNSWIGPEGADQDFVYSTGWYEVKVLGIGAKSVSISSLEQLDAVSPGNLIIFFIDKTAPNQVNGFTLHRKVAQVRACLKASSSALNLFNEKLLRYGYIDLPEYEQQWYRLSRSNRYNVDEHFPRLIRINTPSQVVGVSYQLSIQALENWKVE